MMLLPLPWNSGVVYKNVQQQHSWYHPGVPNFPHRLFYCLLRENICKFQVAVREIEIADKLGLSSKIKSIWATPISNEDFKQALSSIAVICFNTLL